MMSRATRARGRWRASWLWCRGCDFAGADIATLPQPANRRGIGKFQPGIGHDRHSPTPLHRQQSGINKPTNFSDHRDPIDPPPGREFGLPNLHPIMPQHRKPPTHPRLQQRHRQRVPRCQRPIKIGPPQPRKNPPPTIFGRRRPSLEPDPITINSDPSQPGRLNRTQIRRQLLQRVRSDRQPSPLQHKPPRQLDIGSQPETNPKRERASRQTSRPTRLNKRNRQVSTPFGDRMGYTHNYVGPSLAWRDSARLPTAQTSGENSGSPAVLEVGRP